MVILNYILVVPTHCPYMLTHLTHKVQLMNAFRYNIISIDWHLQFLLTRSTTKHYLYRFACYSFNQHDQRSNIILDLNVNQ